MKLILGALMPVNRLAITVSIVTGLRISDVLSIKAADLKKERFQVVEQKTLKKRIIRIPLELRRQMTAIAGPVWVFEHRYFPLEHRTRQAVYKDIKRAAVAFRIKKITVAPHSARKIYAVEEFKKDMNIKRVKELLNHSSEAVTLIYAMADEITARRQQKKK